jgi:hypothetical protein
MARHLLLPCAQRSHFHSSCHRIDECLRRDGVLRQIEHQLRQHALELAETLPVLCLWKFPPPTCQSPLWASEAGIIVETMLLLLLGLQEHVVKRQWGRIPV